MIKCSSKAIRLSSGKSKVCSVSRCLMPKHYFIIISVIHRFVARKFLIFQKRTQEETSY